MAIIVEYKRKKKVVLIESPSKLRIRKYINEFKTRKRLSPQSSIHTDVAKKLSYYYRSTDDLKCWKNQKHAKRGYMRHLHRMKPAIRSLMHRCIYPNVHNL